MTFEDAYRVMDLKALRCLWALAKRGTLTGEGIELGISEPSVSKRIKALEEHLGTKVYEVRGGRVRLTPAGERTFQLAVEIFDRLESFEQELTDQDVRGTVTLSAEDSVQLHLLPEIVQQFTRAYPRVRLRLVNRSPEQTIQMVRNNEADLGVIGHRSVPAGLIFQLWRSFHSYLLLPPGHPLTIQARKDFRLILRHESVMRFPLIVPAEDRPYLQRVRDELHAIGLPLNVAFEVGSFETAKRYVSRGLGIAVIPGMLLTDEDREMLNAIEIPPQFQGDVSYGLLMRHGKYVGAALRRLLRLFDEEAGSASSPTGTA